MGERAETVTILELANQFGLIGFIAVSLAILTILIALGGIYAFFDVRRTARKIATKEARRIAESLAEQTANAYLQRELPAMIVAYSEMAQNAVNADQANDIAGAQEDEHGQA